MTPRRPAAIPVSVWCSLISDAGEGETSVVRNVGILVKRPTRAAVLREHSRGDRKREKGPEKNALLRHTRIVLPFAGARKDAAGAQLALDYPVAMPETCAVELRILAPNPGFGNVARRPTSVLR